MADLPILFSAPMVRALIAGTKTQTRRILSPEPTGHVWRYGWEKDSGATWSDEAGSHKLRFWAGDRLYVREDWRTTNVLDDIPPRELKSTESDDVPWTPIRFEADGATRDFHPLCDPAFGKHRQAMHMPKWASRITLIVEDVKVERLQDISEADAIAEGIEPVYDERSPGKTFWKDYECYPDKTPHAHAVVPFVLPSRSYCSLWEEINGHGSWIDNPWVVAYTFRRIMENIDQVGGENG